VTKTVTLLKGLPGSGKSTWAKEQLEKHPGRYKRICKDDLRAMLDNGHWSKANEKYVLQVRDSLILSALNAGYHVLIDDTNLLPKHEQTIRELVKGIAQVEIQDFTDVPLETCIERDLKRLHSVGERVIRDMYRQFIYKPATTPMYDHSLPDAIICDLDGTLALMNGRSPYDTAKCEDDLLNEPVADIVKAFAPEYTVLFTSGRSEQYRTQTQQWLHFHCFDAPYGDFHLFMRSEGDSRKDAIVKRELYERFIQDRYNVRFVLDDRKQVVELWRNLGLTCLQVADGDY
jgi:predicted kinase